MLPTGDDNSGAAPEELAGTFLESLRGGPAARRRVVRDRIYRWKLALLKQTERHPYVSTCVLVGFIFVGFLIGVTWTCLAHGGRQESSHGGAGGSSDTPAGEVASLPTLRSERVHGGEIDHSAGRRDVAKELIARVVDISYSRRSDVATGRFLKDFENQWSLLVDVDGSTLHPARRGKGWVQVVGPYSRSESHWTHASHLSATRERGKEATEAIIRIVDEDGAWKLEHIRVD